MLTSSKQSFWLALCILGSPKNHGFQLYCSRSDSFDPRAALVALPLLLWYNRHSIWTFIAGSAVFLLATNLPFFFYYGIGFAFLKATTNASIVSQMYLYDWIPLYAITSLTMLEIITVLYNQKSIKNGKFKALIIKLRDLIRQEANPEKANIGT